MAAELKQDFASEVAPKVKEFGSLPAVLNGFQNALEGMPERLEAIARSVTSDWYTLTPLQRHAVVQVMLATQLIADGITESLRQNKAYLHPDLFRVYQKDLERFTHALGHVRTRIERKLSEERARAARSPVSEEELTEHKRALQELERGSQVFTAEEFKQRFR